MLRSVMTMRDHEREGGLPRDDVAVDRTSLPEDVSEASRFMKSPSPEDRRAGRALLLRVSAEHGHAAVEAAQAQQGLLPEGHMAYWKQ
ncbi:MAG: hypothetical protein EA400_14690 [Chromatiaceae bacterium]|nr:MAG: hypothetical protein EA400_14690 [Chromatiaceae bacterium]